MSSTKKLENKTRSLIKNIEKSSSNRGINLKINGSPQQEKLKPQIKKDRLSKSVSFEQSTKQKNQEKKKMNQQLDEKIKNKISGKLEREISSPKIVKQIKKLSQKSSQKYQEKDMQKISKNNNQKMIADKSETKQRKDELGGQNLNIKSVGLGKKQKQAIKIQQRHRLTKLEDVKFETNKIQTNKQYLQILDKFKKMAGHYKNPYYKSLNPNFNQPNNQLTTMPITNTNTYSIKNKIDYQTTFSPQQAKRIGIKKSPQVVLQRWKQAPQDHAEIFSQTQKFLTEKLADSPILMAPLDNKVTSHEVPHLKKTNFKDKNKTSIKFLAQKEHEIENAGQRQYNLKIFQVQNARPDLTLNSTKRSISLPFIPKSSKATKDVPKQQTKEKYINNINDRYKSASQQAQQKQKRKLTKEKRPLTIQNKLQKQRQLNTVAFSLLNLKQRIQDIKGKNNKNSRLTIVRSNTSIINKTEQNKIPNKYYQSQFWVNKSRVMNLTSSNNKNEQNKKEEQSKGKQIQKNEQKIIIKDDEENKMNLKEQQVLKKEENEIQKQEKNIGEIQTKNNNIKKLKQKKQYLQQIKQQIQNENLEKEELLKQHRNINKNLQIDVINKRQRISQLQNQLNKIQPSQNQQLLGGEIKKVQVQELQRQKEQKQKKYKKQKQLVREQIKKIQQSILQQELKYKTLKSQELQMRNQELVQKQSQLKQRNKQLEDELQRKTKQLQQKIKSQQQKLSIYKLELQAQSKKNQEICNELKQQDELQQLLILQIQRIVQEKDHEAKAKEQQKNKDRMRIIQQIKDLEDTQNKLLIEYQRDSQAINSIFQAMRLKNIELENSIKQKLRQKQKQKQGSPQQKNIQQNYITN